MAVLSDPDRALVATSMNRSPDVIQGLGITKADLRAAIDAIDTWLDSNFSSLNAAIPQPARSALSGRQKAAIISLVASRRFGVS